MKEKFAETKNLVDKIKDVVAEQINNLKEFVSYKPRFKPAYEFAGNAQIYKAFELTTELDKGYLLMGCNSNQCCNCQNCQCQRKD